MPTTEAMCVEFLVTDRLRPRQQWCTSHIEAVSLKWKWAEENYRSGLGGTLPIIAKHELKITHSIPAASYEETIDRLLHIIR